MTNDLLSTYHKKRDFKMTGEPKGKTGRRKNTGLAFVIQKHGARRLHYDFRLELDGVMKSWAVTRGPSYDPADKRLAVRTEDHPMDYNKFEGVIPDKQYGAGPVMIWDRGIWVPEGDPHKGLKKGHLAFTIEGDRMHGRWHLVRMHGRDDGKRENWLLIKSDDDFALAGKKNDAFLDEENTSVVSGLTLDEIREGRNREKPAPKPKKPSAAALKKLAALEKKYNRPALATLVEFPPAGEEWRHEIKYDGYRILAFIHDGQVRIKTRGAQDWSHKFTHIAAALAQLNVKTAVLDGEACVLNDKGQTSFSALQAALSDGPKDKIEGWFFDLLYLDGKDYAAKPLGDRKKSLQKILHSAAAPLHYSEDFEGHPDLLEKACKIGAEGLVSKNLNSPYRGRRTHDWLKSKCGLEQEFVIGGFMPAKDNAKAVGALLLGYYKGGTLYYAGKVGTGFSRREAADVFHRLSPLQAGKSPFQTPVERGRRGYVWVRPEQLCEIRFWEWTADGHIRHASFKGLREDKAPQDVHEEKPEKPPAPEKARKKGAAASKKKNFTIEGITITHPEREVFPGTGITKGDIAAYYARAMPLFLPYAENRLISLLRCTETIDGECFFQRAPMQGGKGNITGLTAGHNGRKHNYFHTDSPAGIIEMVQMGSIEFHAWQSHVQDLNKPNQIIFDLDPDESIPFDAVKLAAQDVRNRLKSYGLETVPRLTGGKGIHVVAPIRPDHEWDAVKTFARAIAMEMQRDAPDAYIATMSKAKRTGKIFVDYLRNDFSATAIVPFSLRARKNAPIAVPVGWKELDDILSAAQWHFANIDERLKAKTRKINTAYFGIDQALKL